jgi:hypothetical protein
VSRKKKKEFMTHDGVSVTYYEDEQGNVSIPLTFGDILIALAGMALIVGIPLTMGYFGLFL